MRHCHLAAALLCLATSAIAQPQPPPLPQPDLAVVVGTAKVAIGGREVLPTDDLFEIGDATLKPLATPALDALGKALVKSAVIVRIEIHTDDTAPDNDKTGAWTIALSQRRADAIKAALVKRGVPAARLVAVGMGSRAPLDAGNTDEARAHNRRLELPLEIEVRPPLASDLETYAKGIKGKGRFTATIETSLGTLHCELFADRTPATVANFIGLATGKKPFTDPKTGAVVKNRPFYDGLVFHRIIPQFMIQGGDPLGVGTGGPGYKFADEIDGSLHHEPGTLAMANAGPGTNGSQFFIDEVTSPHLDGKHTIFGKCAELEVVMAIGAAPRDGRDRPIPPITIKRVKINRAP
ncbi:MAG: peptidylprolyl isomerase [Proteobacteria bacterium]|nr:peptidylprolyl isomerase [Pseudomonadota bacterium]